MTIKTKRIYEPAESADGFRLLIMRLWPRGVRKDCVDAWERGLAPTRGLLADFNASTIDWPAYARRFLHEMATRDDSIAAVTALRERTAHETITLLCGCEDPARCHRTLVQGLIAGGASGPLGPEASALSRGAHQRSGALPSRRRT